MSDYLTPDKEVKHELVIRKSRFIGYAFCTDSRTSRTTALDIIRQRYPDASHVCHASRIGSPASGQLLFDDDGEPSGTAGRPILNVITHSKVGDITIAVVRYFGGIKLGAGGLVRAYSAAAAAVIHDLPLKQKISLLEVEITCKFSEENLIRQLIEISGATDIKPHYHESLTLSFTLPAAALEKIRDTMNHQTQGEAELVIRQERH